MSIRDEILTVLEELGGEVVSPDGLATRYLAARIASTASQAQVSNVLGQLDREGLVERDQPNLKRTTRIALAGPGVRPGRKGAQVLAERASRAMAEELEGALRDVLDGLEETHEAARAAADARARTLAHERDQARRERDQMREERDAALAAYHAAEEDLAAAREQAQIATHNAEVWRQQALGRPRVRELLGQVREQVNPATRRELERLMHELPEGR